MIEDVKISKQQLIFMLAVFFLGDFALINPSKGAGQDAWLVFLIGWIGGFLLIGIYSYISILNPGKTLIDILKDSFGKTLGSIIGILYIWYFIHLASLVLRTSGEYMIAVNYPETPLVFINAVYILLLAYAVKKGLEVIGRASEVFTPILIMLVLTTTSLLIGEFNFKNFIPILNKSFGYYLKEGYSVLTFPFGEAVVFLMIFPYLNTKEKLLKTAYTAIFISGIIMIIIMLRDLLVLGPDMLKRNIFPPHSSASLIPGLAIEPFISVNLLISGGGQIVVCMYAALIGITQILDLDDYKPLVHPIAILIVTTSIWIYDDISKMFQIAREIFPFYSIPFQFIFPILILVVSLIKRKSKKAG